MKHITLDPRITLGELQQFALLVGGYLKALPDGGIAIVKTQQPNKGDIKCPSTQNSTI